MFSLFCELFLALCFLYFVVHFGLIISTVTSFFSPSQWLQAAGGAGDVGGGVTLSCVLYFLGFW